MPIVTIKCLERVFSLQQQQQLIEAVNDAFARIAGEAIRPHTIVLIEEVRSGLWSRGGELLTVDDLLRARAARQAAELADQAKRHPEG